MFFLYLNLPTTPRATIGSGNDSVLIDNNARVRLDMTKAEGTFIIPYSGRVILDNYNPNSRASILFSDVNDVTSAIKDETIKLVDDTVRSKSSSVTVNDSLNGATLVNLSSANGYIQKVGFLVLTVVLSTLMTGAMTFCSRVTTQRTLPTNKAANVLPLSPVRATILYSPMPEITLMLATVGIKSILLPTTYAKRNKARTSF